MIKDIILKERWLVIDEGAQQMKFVFSTNSDIPKDSWIVIEVLEAEEIYFSIDAIEKSMFIENENVILNKRIDCV